MIYRYLGARSKHTSFLLLTSDFILIALIFTLISELRLLQFTRKEGEVYCVSIPKKKKINKTQKFCFQTYRVMKKTIVHSHLDTIATALDDEFETIISQWISNSYMEHMRKYLETGQF